MILLVIPNLLPDSILIWTKCGAEKKTREKKRVSVENEGNKYTSLLKFWLLLLFERQVCVWCVCVYVCACVCVCECVWVCMCLCVCVCVCVCVCIDTTFGMTSHQKCIYTYTSHIYAYICIYAPIYIFTYVHIYLSIYLSVYLSIDRDLERISV